MAGMNVVQVKGTLTAGPPKGSTSSFPSAFVQKAFELKQPSKSAAVSTAQTRNLNSPGSYSGLDGIGSGETVTKANFLFLQTETPMLLRLTYDDGAGGNVVSIEPVDGLCIKEVPANKFIKLLEAQGTGVVEYFASGNE